MKKIVIFLIFITVRFAGIGNNINAAIETANGKILKQII